MKVGNYSFAGLDVISDLYLDFSIQREEHIYS